MLICAECIFEHSGHQFVRREESSYVVEETSREIKKLIKKAETGLKYLEEKQVRDLEMVDEEVKRIIENVHLRSTSLKNSYQKLVKEEKDKINVQLKVYQDQLQLLDINKSETEEDEKEETKEEPSKNLNKIK